MIGRSAKNSLRTGGAYVKFNTDGGRLEPLIIGMSEKLGYIVEPLDKDTILAMEDDGKNVSHAIYLQNSNTGFSSKFHQLAFQFLHNLQILVFSNQLRQQILVHR